MPHSVDPTPRGHHVPARPSGAPAVDGQPDGLSRRSVLGGLVGMVGLGGALASGGLGWARQAGAQQPPAGAAAAPGRARALRVAHLTDVHVQPERKADAGFAHTLRRLAELPDRPEVVFNTGDMVFDIMEQGLDRAALLWGLWDRCLRDGPRLDWYHCLGNHDILGTNRPKSKLTGSEPGYGKAMACDRLAMPRPFYRFDRAGWRFIVLDSVSVVGDGYDGKLDAEQLEWLAGELAGTPAATPVMILSHIPILSVTPLGGAKRPENGAWAIKTGVMSADWAALRELFRKHRCVKACISGHIHQVDRVEFEGVTYLCGGAVSGAWWKGRNQMCEPGFNVLDLYPDGRVEASYVETGWKAAE